MQKVMVGTVAALYRYPVKSMRAEPLAEGPLYWHGFAGDRRYAFVRSGNLTRFPWLTAREVPDMLLYRPYVTDLDDPRECPVGVRTPDGLDLPVESEELRAGLEAKYGAPVYLLHSGRGSPDSAGISLLSLASVRALGERIGQDLDPRRFRQNILIEPAGGEPYLEEGWADRVLSFGEGPGAPRIRLNRPDPRCMMVNLDPDRAVQNPAVLREITRTRDTCLGMYASVEALGTIRPGDPVYLTSD